MVFISQEVLDDLGDKACHMLLTYVACARVGARARVRVCVRAVCVCVCICVCVHVRMYSRMYACMRSSMSTSYISLNTGIYTYRGALWAATGGRLRQLLDVWWRHCRR